MIRSIKKLNAILQIIKNIVSFFTKLDLGLEFINLKRITIK